MPTLQEDKGLFLQEYPEDDISCFLAGSQLVLDAEALLTFISFKQPPVVRFNEWDIWKEPQDGVPYIVGGDPSDGKLDYSAGWILDAVSLEGVARYHDRVTPTHFAKVLVEGAQMYNNALITVETPGPGFTVLDRLTHEWGYKNLYYYVDEMTGKVRDEPGWPENVKTRSLVIDTLQEHTNKKLYRIYDERTIAELTALTWRRVGNMKRARAEAARGSHDDLVFALALAICTAQEAVHLFKKSNGVVGKKAVIIDPYAVMQQEIAEGKRVVQIGMF